MKHRFFFVLFLCLMGVSLFSLQELIENSDKPLNPDAGRILKLEEELRITDEGGEFFFQYPNNVKIAPDGSIFLQDRELLLRLDGNGKYIHNYYKKGEGPGELQFVRDYAFQDGKLVVINSNPIKIVTFDFNGEFVDDVTIRQAFLFFRFLFLKDGRIYFFRNERPEAGDKPGVLDAPYALISMDMNGQDLQEHLTLPYQIFDAGGARMGLGRLTTVSYKSKFLFIANTEEYLVKLFDVESAAMLRSFNRDYRRVKPPKDYRWGGVYGSDGKRMGPPPPEYLFDVSSMDIVNDLLWVHTSTKDEDQGFLIDVFDFDGTFVDSFYLNTYSGIVGAQENSIFIKEADEDELVSIVKYKIIG
jgi:hypothetical protein